MALNVSLFGGPALTPSGGTGGTSGGLLGAGIVSGGGASTQSTLLGGSALTGSSGYGYGTLGLLGNGGGYGGYGSAGPTGLPVPTPPPPQVGPQGKDIIKNGKEETDITFEEDDFVISDGSEATHVKILTLPANGLLKLDGGSITENFIIPASQLGDLVYDPANDFFGVDSFTVAMSIDGEDFDSTPSKVTLSLIGTADAPTINQPAAMTISEGTVNTAIAQTLADSFSDVDKESLASVTIDAVPSQGTLQYTKTGESVATVVTNGTTLSAAELATMSYTAPTGITSSTAATLVYKVTDSGGSTSASATTLSLTLTDGNDAPTISAAQTITLPENDSTSKVGDANQATDEDDVDSSLIYSLGGADKALFTVDSSTGQISAASPGLDFEALDTDDSGSINGDEVIDLKLIATDAGGLKAEQTVTVTVTDLTNENKPVFSGVPSSVSVDEGETETGITLAATDADGDSLTYSLPTYGDNDRFEIDGATNKLVFDDSSALPDADTPADTSTTVSAAGDNVFDVQVEVYDGDNRTTQTIAVTLVPTNDNDPEFDSPPPADPIEMDEGETDTGYQAEATDDDEGTGGTITYKLASGYGDNSFFSINSSDGTLSFKTAPDHEDPQDQSVENSGGVEDNVYEVKVIATDGTNEAEQTVKIEVMGVDDDAPIFADDISFQIGEDAEVGAGVHTGSPDNPVPLNSVVVSGGDLPVDSGDIGDDEHLADENDIITYTITGGNTGNAFSIGYDGQIKVAGELDHETLDEYELTVQAKDAKGNLGTGTVTVTVTDADDKPTGSDYSLFTSEDMSVVLGDKEMIARFADYADVDGEDISDVVLVSGPSNGKVVEGSGTTAVSDSTSISGASWTYVPDADFNGTDTFEIALKDAAGTDTFATAVESEAITVTVTVDPVNDRPVLLFPGVDEDSDNNPVGVGSNIDLSSSTAGVYPRGGSDSDYDGDEDIAEIHTTSGGGAKVTLTEGEDWVEKEISVELANGDNQAVLTLNAFDADGAKPTKFIVQQYDVKGDDGWLSTTGSTGWDTTSDDFSVDSNGVLRFTDKDTNGTFTAGNEVLIAVQAEDSSGLKSDYYMIDVSFA